MRIKGIRVSQEGGVLNNNKDNDVSDDIIDISSEIKDNPSKIKEKKEKKEAATTSVKEFRTKKKSGWVKWLVIVVIVAAVIGYVVYKGLEAKKNIEDALNKTDTTEATVERMDISSTISTTGLIQSKDVRTLTSPLSGVKIDEVNVEVGDMVDAGAIVVTFSREDINKKIGQIEEDITEAKQTKALDGGDRDYTYLNNYGNETYNVASSYQGVQRAGEDLQKARDDLQKAYEEKADYRGKYEEAKEKIDGVKDELEYEKVEYQFWKANGDDPENPEPPDMSKKESIEKDQAFQTKISDLTAKVTEYETRIKNYDTGIDTYIKAVETAQKNVDTQQRSYDDAVVKQNKAGYDSVFNSAKYDYNYNKGNVTANDNVKSLERQREERIDSLDNYIVTAPISGLVTAVNAQEGNGYQATTGALMTIQAVDVLEVTTQVDEYDINNVKIGQRVMIMTDGTGSDEFEGKVTFIAPTATASTGNASSNTFEVRIDILHKDERLRLGMSAKLNILVDTHKDVLAVPYDAIEQKDDGTTFVYVVDKSAADAAAKTDEDTSGIKVIGIDGLIKKRDEKDKDTDKDKDAGPTVPDDVLKSAKEIPVQVGLEGDFYSEVMSPKIKEGMTVLVNNKAGELQNDMEMMMGR